ncbi:hypothetical protein JNM05_13210 [bacterium]|nr:hypothetical protein [bacterium]
MISRLCFTLFLILIVVPSCDKNDDSISGITETDALGNIISTDERDWQITSSNHSSGSMPSLQPAYPNPTDGPLTFRFGFPDTMRVTIQIKNSKRVIRTLLDNEFRQIGYHTIQWDLKDDEGNIVPNGLYRCVFSFSSGTKTSKGYGDIEVDVL